MLLQGGVVEWRSDEDALPYAACSAACLHSVHREALAQPRLAESSILPGGRAHQQRLIQHAVIEHRLHSGKAGSRDV